MAKTFDSTDWIEDACDLLQKSDFQYVILTGITEDQTRIDSDMEPSQENEDACVHAIREHFRELRRTNG